LLRSGLSAPGVLCCVSALSLLTLVGAVASVAWHAQWVALVSVLAVFHILIATRLFGHAELELLMKRLATKLFRSGPDGEPHRVEVRIHGSADWSGLWRNLTSWAEDLKLESLCLDIDAPALHEAYFGRWERDSKEVEDHNVWRAQVPLTAEGHSLGRLETVGRHCEGSAYCQIAILATLLEKLESALGAIVVQSSSQPATVGSWGRKSADTATGRSSSSMSSRAGAGNSPSDSTSVASLAHCAIAAAQVTALSGDGIVNVAALETEPSVAKEVRKPR
jgi:UDP-GlcNAc:undecaprenyl-phosphate GlcNAc-1-phosphate transferase